VPLARSALPVPEASIVATVPWLGQRNRFAGSIGALPVPQTRSVLPVPRLDRCYRFRWLDGATGAAGSIGATGAAGSIGATGAPGSTGVADERHKRNERDKRDERNRYAACGDRRVTAIPTGVALVTVVSLTVPAGRYIVLAKTQIAHTGAGDSVDCFLKSAATTIDQSSMRTLPALAATTVPLQAVVTTVGASTVLTVQCNVEVASGSANFSRLFAIPPS
jgi:hypothetical protein